MRSAFHWCVHVLIYFRRRGKRRQTGQTTGKSENPQRSHSDTSFYWGEGGNLHKITGFDGFSNLSIPWVKISKFSTALRGTDQFISFLVMFKRLLCADSIVLARPRNEIERIWLSILEKPDFEKQRDSQELQQRWDRGSWGQGASVCLWLHMLLKGILISHISSVKSKWNKQKPQVPEYCLLDIHLCLNITKVDIRSCA